MHQKPLEEFSMNNLDSAFGFSVITRFSSFAKILCVFERKTD